MKKIALAIGVSLISSQVIAQDPSAACLNEVPSQERFAPISKKVSLLSAKDQTFEMLTNATKATKEDKKLISAWVAELERCLSLGADFRKANQPEQVLTMIEGSRVEFLTTTADLYSGKLTYGEYAKLRSVQLADFERRFSEFTQSVAQRNQEAAAKKQQIELQERQRAEAEIRRQEMIASQREEARRQAALGILMNQKPFQPYQAQPYQMPTPTTTHCSTFGNQIDCTSR